MTVFFQFTTQVGDIIDVDKRLYISPFQAATAALWELNNRLGAGDENMAFNYFETKVDETTGTIFWDRDDEELYFKVVELSDAE